jgi:hypothetical protein
LHSTLKALYLSQKTEHKTHQVALMRINDSLHQLQGQVGVNLAKVRREGTVSTREVAGDSQVSPMHWRSRHYALPLGQIVASHNSVSGKKSNCPNVYHSTLTFTPPSWLSSVALHWDFDICKVVGGLSRLTLSLTPIRYNPSPELKAAITNFDIPELQRLFREGIARPTDHIVLRRPVSLLEVRLQPYVNATMFHNLFHRMIRPLLRGWRSRIVAMNLLRCTDFFSRRAVSRMIPCK